VVGQVLVDGIQLLLAGGGDGDGDGEILTATAGSGTYCNLSHIRGVLAYDLCHQGIEFRGGQSHGLDGEFAGKL